MAVREGLSSLGIERMDGRAVLKPAVKAQRMIVSLFKKDSHFLIKVRKCWRVQEPFPSVFSLQACVAEGGGEPKTLACSDQHYKAMMAWAWCHCSVFREAISCNFH